MPFEVTFQNFSSWPQTRIIPDASPNQSGVMTPSQVANLAAALIDILALESTDGQRPVPLVDGAVTDDVVPQDIALVGSDNTARVADFGLTVLAWSDDGADALVVKQGVSYLGDGTGVFTLISASTAVRRETGGAAGWTVTPGVDGSLPSVELVGEAARVINWMVFVDNWSAP